MRSNQFKPRRGFFFGHSKSEKSKNINENNKHKGNRKYKTHSISAKNVSLSLTIGFYTGKLQKSNKNNSNL